MSGRAVVSATVPVAVPAEQVFELLADSRSQARWMVGTTTYPVNGETVSPAVGGELVAFTGVLGVGFLDVMTVTEYLPPHRWVVLHSGHLVRGDGIFTVEARKDGLGCTVSWAEELDLPLGVLGRIGWPVLRPLVRRGLLVSLRRLAALAEKG